MSTNKDRSILDQAIVLPIQSAENRILENIGLGLHFLLGNVLVLNKSLKEMWFGWRAKKIFTEKSDLLAYCRGEGPELIVSEKALKQNIRYWFSGMCTDQLVSLKLTDISRGTKVWTKDLPFDLKDHLIGFRKAFLNWTTDCGLVFDEIEHRVALWPEEVSMNGLNTVGLALKASYIFSSYDTDAVFDVRPFVKAVELCPKSFMAQDLLGWARYRSGEYNSARAAFLSALDNNPRGAGAMAGIMWCAVMTGNEAEALVWALKKAELCGDDMETARQKTLRLLKKHKSS